MVPDVARMPTWRVLVISPKYSTVGRMMPSTRLLVDYLKGASTIGGAGIVTKIEVIVLGHVRAYL